VRWPNSLESVASTCDVKNLIIPAVGEQTRHIKRSPVEELIGHCIHRSRLTIAPQASAMIALNLFHRHDDAQTTAPRLGGATIAAAASRDAVLPIHTRIGRSAGERLGTPTGRPVNLRRRPCSVSSGLPRSTPPNHPTWN